MYCDVATCVIADDKTGVDIGEPNFPITAMKRNLRGIQEVDNPNYAGDHDFHQFKLTPYVFDIIDIPNDSNGSFYKGKLFVGIKDAVFEASSALRYACEDAKVIVKAGLNVDPVQVRVMEALSID